MKYYPPDEYQHCLAVVRRYQKHDGENHSLHQLLMEQRALAVEAALESAALRCERSCEEAFKEGRAEGVKAEHDRLLDDDWNEATLYQMRDRIAQEKFYALLIQAARDAEGLPERALRLLKEWMAEQTARDEEFEEFMEELGYLPKEEP